MVVPGPPAEVPIFEVLLLVWLCVTAVSVAALVLVIAVQKAARVLHARRALPDPYPAESSAAVPSVVLARGV